MCKDAIRQGKLGLYTQPESQKKRKDVGQIYKLQLNSPGSYLFMRERPERDNNANPGEEMQLSHI